MSGNEHLYQKSADAQTEAIAIKSIADYMALQHGRVEPSAEDYGNAEDNLLLALLDKSQALSKIWLQAGMPQAKNVAMAKFLI